MGGVTVWFTGFPASGKSTVAKHLHAQLLNRGESVELLDGDQVRTNISKGLGFSKEDRDSNVSRIGAVCHLLTRNGVVAIAACVSPYREARDKVKVLIGDFIEVHVATPLEECEARDGRGRYAAARRGELTNFTGVDDPYEEPESPDLRVDTSEEPPELCAARVLALLQRRGYISAAFEPRRESPPQSTEIRLEDRLKALGYSSS